MLDKEVLQKLKNISSSNLFEVKVTNTGWQTDSGNGLYYKDIVHGLSTKYIFVSAYDTASKESIELAHKYIDDNTIRIFNDEMINIDVYVLASGIGTELVANQIDDNVVNSNKTWSSEKTSQELNDIELQLTKNITRIDNINNIEINLLNEGLIFDGTDQSLKLQSILDRYKNKFVTLTFPHGKNIKLQNLTFTGDLFVKGNMCTITGDNNNYIFNTKDDAYLHLTIENLCLKGDIGLANLSLINHDNTGTSISARGIKGLANNRTATFIKATSTDFMNVENITLTAYDKGIEVVSDVVGSDRANTQISIKNFGIGQCNYGAVLRGCSKFNIENFDISVCKTGLWVQDHNNEGKITNFHCEYHGSYENSEDQDGYGIYVSWITNQINFECCDVILPATHARGGLYITPETYSDIYYNKIKFSNCSIYPYNSPVNYKAVTLNGAFMWEGEFPYEQKDASMGGANNKILFGEIRPSMYNRYNSRNILGKEKLTQQSDFTNTIGTGTATFATEKGYTIISNTSGNDVSLALPINADEIGWYTLIFNGYLGVQDNVVLGEIFGNWNTLFASYCHKIYENQTNKIYFYVNDLSYAPTVRFEVKNGSKIKLGDIGVYKGFKSEF